ncbi:MAG TPA: hypothetical protein VIU11_01070 [Nakamurella sp.]
MTKGSGGLGDPAGGSSGRGSPPGRGEGAGPGSGSADDSRAEVVLSQALRAMAGGQAAPSPTGGRAYLRLSTGQLVLLAAIVGLLVGVGAGLLSLLL